MSAVYLASRHFHTAMFYRQATYSFIHKESFTMYIGRFAPSPSGRMHLGNLYAGLLAWLRAKSQGGQILLRIEDLDPLRCPKSFAYQIISDLKWLGLPFDNQESVVWQSDRSKIYQKYAAVLPVIWSAPDY